MYESPITIAMEEARQEAVRGLEGAVLQAVARAGVTVNREELIRALANDRASYERGYEDGCEAASVWIPVEPGHLPKDREIVLGLSRKGGIQIYEYWAPVGNESRGHFYTTRFTEVDVTHWLPKPKLPEETTNSKADET